MILMIIIILWWLCIDDLILSHKKQVIEFVKIPLILQKDLNLHLNINNPIHMRLLPLINPINLFISLQISEPQIGQQPIIKRTKLQPKLLRQLPNRKPLIAKWYALRPLYFRNESCVQKMTGFGRNLLRPNAKGHAVVFVRREAETVPG